MNSDDKTLDLIEEFLGSDDYDYDGPEGDLLDADWDGEDMFAA